MRFFISKRLPFGLRAGVLFNPLHMKQSNIRPGGSIARLGEGVSGIYVMTGAHNMCKIGISTDPELRIASLQTGSHVPLKLHYVLAVKTIDPRAIEALAHVILDKHRCAGEWFDVPPHMAEDAVNKAAAHYGIKTVQTMSNNLENVIFPRVRFWQTQGFKMFMLFVITTVILTYWLTTNSPIDYSR